MKTVSDTIKKGLIKNDEGSTGVMFALLAVPMFAMMALSVDYARSLNSRESMQLALDAAVLAGRNAGNEQQQIAIAQKYFNANLKKVIASATATFTKNSDGDLEGTAIADVVAPVQSIVAGLLGNNSVTKTGTVRVETFALARADKEVITEVAADPATAVTPCIHVMDQNGTSFELDSNSGVNASTCEVRVRSNNGVAMKEVSSSNVKFKKVLVKGGADIRSAYSSTKLYIVDGNHQVTENAQVTGNPYDTAMASAARAITVGACTTANTNKTWTGNVNPGTYCGDTIFNNATFATGVYAIASGNGSSRDGKLSIRGNSNGSAGVTFFLADNKAQLKQYQVSENKVFKAPTSGPTKGILFFESSNRGQTYSFNLQSVNKQSWTGMFYFPSMDLTMDSLSEWPTMNISIVTNKLKMKSLSSVFSPYSWTPQGYSAPIMMDGETGTKITKKDGWLME